MESAIAFTGLLVDAAGCLIHSAPPRVRRVAPHQSAKQAQLLGLRDKRWPAAGRGREEDNSYRAAALPFKRKLCASCSLKQVARPAAERYVEMASAAIVNLLRTEHAVLWSEAQAKISDARWPTIPRTIDPHHMTTARQRLLDGNRIEVWEAPTRGGMSVPVLHLKDTKGIATAIARAAARKRALASTLNSWTTPRPGYPRGFIGEAGERVAHRSLLSAAPHGLTLIRPEGGEVARILDAGVPGGPLDSACWVQARNPQGVPVDVILCPIEVKNIRHWIYPSARELHQVLHKAALLQRDNPDMNICPVLITRKKSYTTNLMSRELGFRVLDIHKQFVLPVREVDRSALSSIQKELGFVDLTPDDEADPGLVAALRNLVPTALPNATLWKQFGPELIDHFEVLREDLSTRDQKLAMGELHEAVEELGGEARW